MFKFHGWGGGVRSSGLALAGWESDTSTCWLDVAPASVRCHAKRFPASVRRSRNGNQRGKKKSGLVQLHVISLCCAPVPQKICWGGGASSVRRKRSSDLTPLSYLILKQYVYARNQKPVNKRKHLVIGR